MHWQHGFAPEDCRARWLRIADSHAFVERHIPSWRQVIHLQCSTVDRRELFHRFAECDFVFAISWGNGGRRNRDAFPRPRLCVDRREMTVFVLRHRCKKAHATHTEGIRHESHLSSIPRKDHRTTGNLPLDFGDRVRSLWNLHFTLRDIVGPINREKINHWRKSKSDHARICGLSTR